MDGTAQPRDAHRQGHRLYVDLDRRLVSVHQRHLDQSGKSVGRRRWRRDGAVAAASIAGGVFDDLSGRGDLAFDRREYRDYDVGYRAEHGGHYWTGLRA